MKKTILIVISILFALTFYGTPAKAFIPTPMPLNGTWLTYDEFNGGSGNFFNEDFYWTSSSSVKFDITDFDVVTDEFKVYDNGVLVLTTPDLPDYNTLGIGAFTSPPFTNDPNVAWVTNEFSKGSITLASGSHDITIMDTRIPNDFSDGTVALRAESVPEPATMLLFGLGLIGLAGARRKIKK